MSIAAKRIVAATVLAGLGYGVAASPLFAQVFGAAVLVLLLVMLVLSSWYDDQEGA